MNLMTFTFARSRGPGGQNVNKINSKAQLSIGLDDLAAHLEPWMLRRLVRLACRSVTEDSRLILSADASRSQRANRQACIDKLRELLVQATTRPKVRRKTRPTKGSVERRLTEKKRRSDIKRRRSGESS
ncbi:MAG: aminoacyl-tRNA hydrolase [Planctomycetes bacterium]|nr:aminoacyl-tRNA hydrolase [Planctomycetota bacterium]